MRKLSWTPKSIRNFKRLIRQNPRLRQEIDRALQQLVVEPSHSSLRTHKLKGDLADTWACSIDYSYRILFKFVQDQEEESILLINIGTHDDVY